MKPKNTERKKNQIKFVSIVSLPHLQLHTVSSKQKTKTHISCKTVPFVFKWPRINSHKTTHTHTHRHTSVFHFAACEAHFAPFSPTPRNGVTSARRKMIPPSSVYVERARERDSLVVFFLAGRVFLGCSSEMKKSKNQSCYEKIICTLKRVIHTHTHTRTNTQKEIMQKSQTYKHSNTLTHTHRQ